MKNVEPKGFHWRDRIYFERSSPQEITITQYHDSGYVIWLKIIPISEAASIFASCSGSGETSEKYYAALKFLQS